jgi:endonuclease YncB( thermonuclease family)
MLSQSLMLLLLAVLAAGCATVGDQATTPAGPAARPSLAPVLSPSSILRLGDAPIGEVERARVVRVVDGDTIIVDRGQGKERVRYTGVDTPESVKPDTPIEFMAKEASAANAAMVAGREVLLERDVSDRDRFDRLLRYVWIEDPDQPSGMLLVNLALVAQGYAQVVTYPPDVRYADVYLEAQRTARAQGLGLWGEATPVP